MSRGTPELDTDVRLARLLEAYGSETTVDEVIATAVRRLDELAVFSEEQAGIQNRTDLLEHADLYRRDAARLRASTGPATGRTGSATGAR